MQALEDLKTQVVPYKRYDTSIMSTYDTVQEDALDLTQEQIEAIQTSWDETKKHNMEAQATNRRINSEMVKISEKFCKALGIETYKISKNGKVLGEYKTFKELKKYVDDIANSFCPYSMPFPHNIMVNGKSVRINHSPCTLLQLVEYGKSSEIEKPNFLLNTS